jgi:uncharacterized SAM-binding protein YcdF (DUF218 family)
MTVRALRVIGAAGIGLLLAVGFTPLPNVVSYWMAPSRALAPAGAIVVLGRGGVSDRGELNGASLFWLMEGVDLYRRGLAPLLVVSGSPFGAHGTEAERRADVSRECGIPGSAVLTLTSARTTHDEALGARAILDPRGVRRVILVTDGQAMGRAMALFERAGFDVIPSYGAPVLQWGGTPEARLGVMKRVVTEAVARLYYRLAGYL